MHHARLAPVGRHQGLADLRADLDGLLPHELPPGDERVAQGAAAQVLERQHQLSVGLERGQAADDMRVLEPREDLHLAAKEAASVLAPCELGAHHLERDPATGEALLGLVDLAHPALADETPHLVLADPLHLASTARAAKGSTAMASGRRESLEGGASSGRESGGGGDHVLHPERQARGHVLAGEHANLPDLQRILRSPGGSCGDLAGDGDGHGVKARIAVGSREDADDRPQRDVAHTGFFPELANDRAAQRLAPFEGAARERPLAVVGATDEEEAADRIPGDGADADDGAAEQVAADLAQESDGSAREVGERGESHGPRCGNTAAP